MTINLKPSLLDKPVPRIKPPRVDEDIDENIDEQESPAVDDTPAASNTRVSKKRKVPAATPASDVEPDNGSLSKKKTLQLSRWKDEEIERLIEMRLNGMSHTDIAVSIHALPSTITLLIYL